MRHSHADYIIPVYDSIFYNGRAFVQKCSSKNNVNWQLEYYQMLSKCCRVLSNREGMVVLATGEAQSFQNLLLVTNCCFLSQGQERERTSRSVFEPFFTPRTKPITPPTEKTKQWHFRSPLMTGFCERDGGRDPQKESIFHDKTMKKKKLALFGNQTFTSYNSGLIFESSFLYRRTP